MAQVVSPPAPFAAIEELFCLEGCREYKQYYEMRQRFELGICPFCTLDKTINKVVYENDHWIVWENAFPRDVLDVQLVIACRYHVRFLEQLPWEAWQAFYAVIQWIEGVEGRYPNIGGNLHIRFGNMDMNAGTVPHLHWNYWVPSGTGEVKIPVFKDPKDRDKNRLRALTFATRYEAGEVPDETT